MSSSFNHISQLRYVEESDDWNHPICRLTGLRCDPRNDDGHVDCTMCNVPIVEMLAGNRKVVE